MKKTLTILTLMLLSITAVNGYTSSQLDAANTLASDGIINNNSTNPSGYKLDQNVLRQEIAAVARGVADISKTNSCMNEFSDVGVTNPNTWACYSIEALLKAELIAANSTFRPEDSITKAEGLGMLVKAACGNDYKYDSNTPGSWQEQVVAYADDKTIVDAFTDYNSQATRGWVFEVGSNAMAACGDDTEIKEYLDEILEAFDF